MESFGDRVKRAWKNVAKDTNKEEVIRDAEGECDGHRGT